MKIGERRAWASKVLNQLRPKLTGVERVVFLAGKRYREFLFDAIQACGVSVCVSLEGMRIGEQLQWFKRELEE